MSADLFAEFNSLSNNPPPPTQPQPSHFSHHHQQQQPVSTSSWGAFATPPVSSKPPVVVEDDDDGWGDFEVAQPTAATAPAVTRPPAVVASPIVSSIAWQSTSQHHVQSPSIPSSINWPTSAQNSSSIPWHGASPAPAPTQSPALAREDPVRNRIVRASTLDLMSNNLVDFSATPQPAATPWGQQPRQQFQQQPIAEVPPSTHEAEPRMRVRPKLKSGPSDPSVLFDAEDFELQVADGDEEDDDDEFGEFESIPPPAPPKPTVTNPPPVKTSPPPPSMDLLSLVDPEPPSQPTARQKAPPSQLLGTLTFGSTNTSYPQAPKSPSFQDRNPFPDLAIKTPTGPAPTDHQLKSASPVTAWPTVGSSAVETKHEAYKDDDDGWGAWDDFPANDGKAKKSDAVEKSPEGWGWDAVDNVPPSKSEKKTEKQPDVVSQPPPESWDWDAVDGVQPPKPDLSDSSPPPTNVPPPSVILSVFPELLGTGDALFKSISGQTASIKQRILADPKAVDFLEGYVLLAVVAARVMAGRKQRWHRDKLLAKSMSISAAGSKGMKLAGVDKTQSAREDREAADVVAVWRAQVGRTRSAVAAAKAAGKLGGLRVPEMAEAMPVHAAKMVPTAPKPCVVCGLKREERVSRVDYDVEDSFGEWWAEHWGHKACKNFWIEHEKMLRQR